ncbi:MAG: hypothetical protein IT380_17135 [Myxococcales bacterium]|nr:hypothetical protein [Myxococcales bacterium]
MTLEGALEAVKVALEHGDAEAAADAMTQALAALDEAKRARLPLTAAVARLVADCQPLLERVRVRLEQQLGELGAGVRASRAYETR